MVEAEESRYSLPFKFRNIEDDFAWMFLVVYGSISNENRELLWEELGTITGLWGEPWCISEHFNVIHFPNKRSREGRISSSMRRFSQIINELELKDLPLQRGSFTWRRDLNNQRIAILDIFLVSNEWEAHFEGVVQSMMPRPTSNHFPILLEGGGLVKREPLPFRFKNM